MKVFKAFGEKRTTGLVNSSFNPQLSSSAPEMYDPTPNPTPPFPPQYRKEK